MTEQELTGLKNKLIDLVEQPAPFTRDEVFTLVGMVASLMFMEAKHAPAPQHLHAMRVQVDYAKQHNQQPVGVNTEHLDALLRSIGHG